jgi:hypothetical protein
VLSTDRCFLPVVKFGQVCSVNPLLVPKRYRDEFSTLQSDLPPVDISEIRAIIEQDLGPIADVFASFDEKSCGAASIGQAHIARLKTGEEVVVKVQYPDAAEMFTADTQCLRTLTRLYKEEQLGTFEEFAKQLATELDYESEVHHLEEIYQHVMPTYSDRVVVPTVYKHLCTPRLITMQYLAGPKLEQEVRRQMRAVGLEIDEGASIKDWLGTIGAAQKGLRAAGVGVDATDGAGAAAAAGGGGPESESDVVAHSTAAGSGNGGSSYGWLVRPALRAIGTDNALWLGGLAARARVRWQRGLWSGGAAGDADGAGASSSGSNGAAAAPAMNHKELRSMLSGLLQVHGHEIFSVGRFNVDPHPGT